MIAPMVPPSVLAAARRGDPDALAELFRSFHAPLLRYLRARRITAAEDVASAVWVDVARSIGRFEGDADDFRRWLFTIAHRRSVDETRRAVRASEVAAAEAVRAPLAAVGADAEHDRATALDRALELVGSLPDAMAEAVMLRVVNDLPVADVAEIMDTTEGNVRVLVHRGLGRLRRKIGVTDEAPPTMKGSS
jgi:RNA polymerase sigma-70 factor (ECF subfamily)